MPINTLVEIGATLCGLVYILFMIRERIICWPFGIAGSLLSIYLFVDSRLYSEAILYLFYVLMGFWGWQRWARREALSDNPVVHYSFARHLPLFALSLCGSLALGWFFSTYTDAARPWFDAATTVFSFTATYLEVKKVLETWLYWIVLNAASIWLYADRSLDIYAALICVYTLLSFWGLLQWWRAWQRENLVPAPAD